MFEMSNKTGVAIIFFNRPSYVEKVFKAVAMVKPKNLFLIQDGCRNEKDEEKVQQCRQIVDQINWDCNVYRNYSNANLGCGKRMYTGISWVFEHIERAIILEDDCVPNIDFFRFCEEMLDRYESDKRILMVSGLNLFEKDYNDYDYFYAINGPIWGWATWKRAWSMYDYTVDKINNLEIEKAIYRMEPKSVAKKDIKQWKATNQKAVKGEKLSFWAHQWRLVKFIENNLCIIPKVNLISNIGDDEATHPGKGFCEFHHRAARKIEFPLKHPNCILANYEYDDIYYKEMCPSRVQRLKKRLLGIFKCKKKK